MSNLSGFVKRLRDIMRNDAGINGDAQRIEQIAWMLFLKVYDAKEQDWECLVLYKCSIFVMMREISSTIFRCSCSGGSGKTNRFNFSAFILDCPIASLRTF